MGGVQSWTEPGIISKSKSRKSIFLFHPRTKKNDLSNSKWRLSYLWVFQSKHLSSFTMPLIWMEQATLPYLYCFIRNGNNENNGSSWKKLPHHRSLNVHQYHQLSICCVAYNPSDWFHIKIIVVKLYFRKKSFPSHFF